MPGTVNFGGDIAFVGGTGRLSGSTGSATFERGASLLSSAGEFALEGALGR
jgi:hypothetical protein